MVKSSNHGDCGNNDGCDKESDNLDDGYVVMMTRVMKMLILVMTMFVVTITVLLFSAEMLFRVCK